jgi:hypothetical protein
VAPKLRKKNENAKRNALEKLCDTKKRKKFAGNNFFPYLCKLTRKTIFIT